ncbi:hypothetical protein PPMP20_26650 [Paraburkholderia phymatum]|uniref:GP66 n=1 Tax=Paraburkholderia phymatum (strain DSM 17167 / CIP 108236 / LMG 21445 / STM815) TaxID=391038 RepID=B2JL31_PARP8|nr:hypothetical protein [Paraburkholderia phymatum]ACC72560.1 GP66 [Paraburkholderia phymatum STM815]
MLAIFADTIVALHVSYAIRATRSVPATSMRNVLRTIMESAEMMNRQQMDWLERLIGRPSRLVDFGGLSQSEVHAQAVMITEAVRRRLPEHESYVLMARFARDIDKCAGVYGVADHLLASGSPVTHREAITDLVWRRYLPREYQGGFSLRDIEGRTRVSKSSLGRAARWLDDECDEVELSALHHLEDMFVEQGVVRYTVMEPA